MLRVGKETTELSLRQHERDGAGVHPMPDLRQLAEWATCAVVGSSGDLNLSGMGKEIDNHTAVIRFNDAPTRCCHGSLGLEQTGCRMHAREEAKFVHVGNTMVNDT